MIVLGCFGKFGALFVTIPEPVVGGMFLVMFGEYINVREYRRANKNRQSRETGNIGYTRRRKTQHNMC
jgi:xanthine/uracil permease